MDEVAKRHNNARYYCIQRLVSLSRLASWQDWAVSAMLQTILNEIECFVEEDFTSADEIRTFLELAAEHAHTQLIAQKSIDCSYIKRRHKLSQAAIDSIFTETYQSFVRFLQAAPDEGIPCLPYRRVLTRKELVDIWSDFEQHKKVLPRRTAYTDQDFQTTVYVQTLIGRSVDRILQLYPGAYFGYELDTSWLNQMFCGDDTYWTSKGYTWYIYADGTGYPVVAGDIL
jgi:hypothetical protein